MAAIEEDAGDSLRLSSPDHMCAAFTQLIHVKAPNAQRVITINPLSAKRDYTRF